MTTMNQPGMYLDGAVTVREVLETNDSARLLWMATWRMMRRRDDVRQAFVLLTMHHTPRTDKVMRTMELAGAARTWPRSKRMSLKGDAR